MENNEEFESLPSTMNKKKNQNSLFSEGPSSGFPNQDLKTLPEDIRNEILKSPLTGIPLSEQEKKPQLIPKKVRKKALAMGLLTKRKKAKRMKRSGHILLKVNAGKALTTNNYIVPSVESLTEEEKIELNLWSM